MELDSDQLLRSLQRLAPAGTPRYVVAFSGGCDSLVLLHLLYRLQPQLGAGLSAVHVEHGLQDESALWAEHCRACCEALEIPCEVIGLALRPRAGESVEALARQARYQALAGVLRPGDALLTAHHRDDQAETLLLQLFRGAGVGGLAAMPARAPLGDGYHLRPLLDYDGAALRDYAQRKGLSWIEDPSNRDQRFDRNFLRLHILPQLRQRWPGIGKTIARSAGHCAEALGLIEEMAARDLEGLRGGGGNTLCREGLMGLGRERRNALLRHWIRSSGFPLPSAAKLESISADLLMAGEERAPLVAWAGAEVRRYRGALYLLPPWPREAGERTIAWKSGRERLLLPAGRGILEARRAAHGIGLGHWSRGPVQVRFRAPGMRCRPAGRGGSRSLKKLFQERGIPPWERERYPLIYIGDALAAVGDIAVCEPFQAADGEEAVAIRFIP
ncbi:MAG: tRNA lysidine(34) synthetase TilS [Candidatus Sedimenticola endophacoides]|uniref:tRNA(Ile)-lysidine synthase n=1 Tax=Candidatus Sedimenticola endophacoides TaxID=2548426 RepID=A0A6N4DNI2_9GAMM|nr:MAG: tRNA lysidine(34) synthetase TilS [Candidatus Sedimenticola endophacoides]OQX40033.1 MAG: tRNA lysidine(34) synthetase TilS [Candidatus Sedimenticola endophacoides]PUD98901.1 MAG: tRNA lysidine(34) synthetase TilS [Candidatus Sedimenticola endophacoides]PUD99808.1 MAG: tRNA lysidine(34) synthetase TilS [Candidatus Sedimenticola endophacoides]PUE02387.1 MAG: tRNA lysidine(34) synthetase TilS [Candidatus Sedimenticola endophacoides]